MAAAFCEYDRTTDIGRNHARAMQMILEGLVLLVQWRDNMVTAFRNGDGTLASHYALMATEGGYVANGFADANAAAKASFDETDSLLAKINTDASVSAVRTAIYQCAGKHNIVP